MRPAIDQLIRPGAVHRSVYTDQDIFDLEMQRIFDTTWVYLAHEAEIPEPGDYKTTMLGRHPVIVSRQPDGEIAVVVNRCRHRGPTVCENETGNSKYFRCPYHFWTYRSSGELIGVPSREAYGGAFKKEDMGLQRVARVDQYQGFIFGSMSTSGPSLQEHLGGVTRFLDAYVSTAPGGKLALFEGSQKCVYNGNWKLQLENGVDPYHVAALHISAVTPKAMEIYQQGGGCVVAMDGHGVTDHTDYGPMPLDASLSGGFNLVIFPNLIVLRSQIRTIRPIAANRTEIHTRVVKLEGAPEEINLRRMRDQEFEFGAAGTFFADDLEIFERTQFGLQSAAVEWLNFSRGLETEQMKNGYLTGNITDETQHRGMYRNWLRMMTAASESVREQRA